MFSVIHYQGIQQLEEVVDKSPEEIEDLKTQLEHIASDTQAVKVNIFPNYLKHHLLADTGLSVKYRLNDPFTADMFRVDRYRILSAVKLDETPLTLTTDELREKEKLFRRCLSHSVHTPPTLLSNATGTWCPSLGDRDTSIGIYQNQEYATVEKALKTNYYLVAQTCLPESYLQEICNHDEKIDQGNKKFQANYHESVGAVDKDIKLVTFRENFGENSHNHRALEIAKENACRLLCVAADILDLVVDADIKELAEPYDTYETNSHIIQYGNPKLLPDALEFYGHGVPIYPFTTLASVDAKIRHSDLPREELRGYPLGYFVKKELEKPTGAAFAAQFKIIYRDTIRSVTPMALTDTNTFRFTDYNYMTWMAGVTETGFNVLTDEGIAVGYRCHNVSPKDAPIRSHEQWLNSADNMYPVTFPKKQLGSKAVAQETLSTIFSLTEGGQGLINGRVPIALLKEEVNNTLMTPTIQHDVFNCTTVPLHLAPVKVYAPNPRDDIWAHIHMSDNNKN